MRYLLIVLLSCCNYLAVGQTDCDSLDIFSIQYTPFSDTAIEITVSNNSSRLFAYPGFVLLDDQNDTVAKEIVNYFGIGSFPQYHFLQDNYGPFPDTSFQATLELWEGFYDTLACSYDLEINLCPDDSCYTLIPYIGNYGGALVTGNYNWVIRDDALQQIASGTFELNDTQQGDLDTICIPYGNYDYIVEIDTATPGGQVYVGISRLFFGPSGVQSQLNTSIKTMPFNLFESCLGIAPGIQEVNSEMTLHITQIDDYLMITDQSGHSLGQIVLHDMNGKQILSRNFNFTNSAKVPIANLSKGMYILTYHTEDLEIAKKVIIR